MKKKCFLALDAGSKALWVVWAIDVDDARDQVSNDCSDGDEFNIIPLPPTTTDVSETLGTK